MTSLCKYHEYEWHPHVHREKSEHMVVWSQNTNEGIKRAQDYKTPFYNKLGLTRTWKDL